MVYVCMYVCMYVCKLSLEVTGEALMPLMAIACEVEGNALDLVFLEQCERRENTFSRPRAVDGRVVSRTRAVVEDSSDLSSMICKVRARGHRPRVKVHQPPPPPFF